MLRVTHDLVPSLLLMDNASGHSAAVQCPPAAAMIRIILLMMAAPKTMAKRFELQADKDKLLELHNEIRSKVAKGVDTMNPKLPKAKNMKKMVKYNTIF